MGNAILTDNMNKIKLLVFDIDGVLTDGKKYIDGHQTEVKAIQLRDLDAFRMIKDAGYFLGCITGEDTPFSRKLAERENLDFAVIGCKDKVTALEEIIRKYGLTHEEVCYAGDGKYDIPALEKAGLAICPADAIWEVKQVSDIVLERKGGEGCLAEIYTILTHCKQSIRGKISDGPAAHSILQGVKEGLIQHREVMNLLEKDEDLLSKLQDVIDKVVRSMRAGGGLFLCGNGGSAADAQHLAAEMVGRFYCERKAFKAQALSVNTSILTSIANDYNYDMIFARQLEAAASPGDVLIGLTTSGQSPNVLEAFKTAKRMQMETVLMTGDIPDYLEILSYTDCALCVPSKCTPRIQEMHILLGHIICEMTEACLIKA